MQSSKCHSERRCRVFAECWVWTLEHAIFYFVLPSRSSIYLREFRSEDWMAKRVCCQEIICCQNAFPHFVWFLQWEEWCCVSSSRNEDREHQPRTSSELSKSKPHDIPQSLISVIVLGNDTGASIPFQRWKLELHDIVVTPEIFCTKPEHWFLETVRTLSVNAFGKICPGEDL
jgi:hypothetical protein